MSSKCDAVLIVGFGGPTSADEIRPFLDNVLRGRPVTRERYEEVVHHYELLGGKSPYNELTIRQADGVREMLRSEKIEVPIAVGMRNWQPYIGDSLRELVNRGARRVLGFIMAAHRSEASWERYQATIEEACASLGEYAPAIEYPAPWHNHPLFIRANAVRVRDAFARLDSSVRSRARLIFTAHSIPVAMAENGPYVEQLSESAQLVAGEIGVGAWSLAYQSRSGSPRDRWLEPAIGDVLRSLDSDTAVVVPIGFVCDHVEVLYDLDVDAAKIAKDAGVKMVRAQTVGDHPLFIEMIASIVSLYVKR
jgi:protoporphyrin/coproporphyrin ferrochelatase